MAAGVQRVKPLTSYQTDLYGGNFVNIWEINGFFPFQGSFHYLFYHGFTLILKSKWRDLNSRLGGCGIYASEIYFSIFWKIKKEKRLKWPSD